MSKVECSNVGETNSVYKALVFVLCTNGLMKLICQKFRALKRPKFVLRVLEEVWNGSKILEALLFPALSVDDIGLEVQDLDADDLDVVYLVDVDDLVDVGLEVDDLADVGLEVDDLDDLYVDEVQDVVDCHGEVLVDAHVQDALGRNGHVVDVVEVDEPSFLYRRRQNLRRNNDWSPLTRMTSFEAASKVRSAICRYVLCCQQQVENKRGRMR